MKMILFNQNPMITKLLESVSKKLELSMQDFNRYQELSTRLKEDPEWILIADDECLEKTRPSGLARIKRDHLSK